MSYAETQQEIIQAHLRGRPRPVPPTSVAASPAPRRLRTLPGPRRATTVRPASAPMTARPALAAAAGGDADADLAAAVAAARGLRFATDVEQIASAAGVTVDHLRGSSRTRAMVEVRRIVAAYLRRRGCSLPEIGRILNREHTTVQHLLRVPARATGLHVELAS